MMRRLTMLVLALLWLSAPATVHSPSYDVPVAISGGGAIEVPGPSFTLWQNPYYSCVRNFYVATTGSDSNTFTQAQNSGTPWLTLAKYDSVIGANGGTHGGDCINVAAGTYTSGINSLANGGTTASPTGYVSYRCSAPGSDHNHGTVTGFSGGGCVITDDGKAICSGAQSFSGCGTTYPNYVVFDGFSFNAATVFPNASAFNCDTGDTLPSRGCHHYIVVNNVINGYGQSGVQLNNTEYIFVLHNTTFSNSSAGSCNGGSQGSGISLAALFAISGYSQTTDDIGPTPKLGIFGSTSPNPIHNYVMFNVSYLNHTVGCTTSTDGNGIIFDTLDNPGTTNNHYGSYSLAAFNVTYNNGGGGIKQQDSTNIIFANNSSFNDQISPDLNGQGFVPSIYVNRQFSLYTPGNTVVINNLSYDILGSGNQANVTPFGFAGYNAEPSADAFYNGSGTAGCPTINGVTDCGGNNIDYQKNFAGTPGNEIIVGNANPAYNCSNNKCMVDPLWSNVDSSGGNSGATGSQTVQPTGTNFALQSSSPAKNYATTRSYLPSWVKDAGACDSSLATCP